MPPWPMPGHRRPPARSAVAGARRAPARIPPRSAGAAPSETRAITGGAGTHADVRVAAALDPIGGLLGIEQFPVTPAGYAGMLGWLDGFGAVCLVGIEGTGSYGAVISQWWASTTPAGQPRSARRSPSWPSRPTRSGGWRRNSCSAVSTARSSRPVAWCSGQSLLSAQAHGAPPCPGDAGAIVSSG